MNRDNLLRGKCALLGLVGLIAAAGCGSGLGGLLKPPPPPPRPTTKPTTEPTTAPAASKQPNRRALMPAGRGAEGRAKWAPSGGPPPARRGESPGPGPGPSVAPNDPPSLAAVGGKPPPTPRYRPAGDPPRRLEPGQAAGCLLTRASGAGEERS